MPNREKDNNNLNEKPWIGSSDWCGFQLNQCRVKINMKLTEEFYKEQPTITENCNCGYCKYYKTVVIRKPNNFFALLEQMKVDLSRQPNSYPDGLSCTGESKKGELGYNGNYFLFGRIEKTSKKSVIVSNDNKVIAVNFKDAEYGNNIQFSIRQVEKNKISFEFFLTVPVSDELAKGLS